MNQNKLERALTHALAMSLGHGLKPLFHRGKENAQDVEAISALMELRQELGIKSVTLPASEAGTQGLEDWSGSKKASQY
jgi:hypothetical protein